MHNTTHLVLMVALTALPAAASAQTEVPRAAIRQVTKAAGVAQSDLFVLVETVCRSPHCEV